MDVYITPREILDKLKALDEYELSELFENDCPQCGGTCTYYDASLDRYHEYCSVCESNPYYKELSLFTKELIKVIDKYKGKS